MVYQLLKDYTEYAAIELTESISIAYDMADMLDLAGIMLSSENFNSAGDFLRSAGGYMEDYSKAAATRQFGTQYWLTKALYLIANNWPAEAEPYELTWKAICEAWAKDDFEGKEWTIACIDHMRKLMWDKPFRIVWASKPKSEAE